MAEKQSDKPKRLVRNPETFRERAIKAAEVGDKPNRLNTLAAASRKAVRPVTSPVGKAGSSIFRLKPFKLLGKVLTLIGRILLPRYIRNSWRELRQVTWPSKQESRQLTFAVLVFAIVFGVVIAVVDYGLDKLFRNVLLK